MDDNRRARVRGTIFGIVGLGHLTFGAGFMALAISNAEHTIWSVPTAAFGGALLTQGVINLSTAWRILPPADPPAQDNGPARVGVPLAPAEQGVPDLAAEGLVLHQNLIPNYPGLGIGGDVDPANVMIVVYQANVMAQINPANDVGEAVQVNPGQEAVPEIIVDEADQEISDDEDDPANASEEGDLDIDVGEFEPANVINEAGPANGMAEVNQADPQNDLVDYDSVDEFQSEMDIEVPRCFTGLDVPSIKFIDSSESDCE